MITAWSEEKEWREGRLLATLENYRDGLFGPDTTEVSLHLLGYDASDIRLLMSEYKPREGVGR